MFRTIDFLTCCIRLGSSFLSCEFLDRIFEAVIAAQLFGEYMHSDCRSHSCCGSHDAVEFLRSMVPD